MSYARYLLEIKLGRYLTDNEEADHIDENKYNDNINNLQILAHQRNVAKSNKSEMLKVTCRFCDKIFEIEMRRYMHNQIKQGKAGPYCSKRCAGRAHN
jgi:hypothetical protein